MARIRYLKPEFFTDSDLCELSPLHRLLFQGLWCQADRDGVLEDKPRELKVKILPFDDCDAEAMLCDLHARGFVVRYEVGGQRLIFIPGMAEHQKFHKDEKPKGYQLPPGFGSVGSASTVPAPSQHGASTVPAGLVTGNGERGRVTGNGGAPRGGPGLADAVTQPHSILPADQLPTVTDLKAFQPKQPSPAVAAHAEGPPLAERMDAVFAEVRGGAYRQVSRGRDSDALAIGRLLGKGSHAEILTRWKRGLQWRGFPGCSTWMELDANWNAYAKTQDSTAGPGKAGGDRPRL